jgi:hypothetical protein
MTTGRRGAKPIQVGFICYDLDAFVADTGVIVEERGLAWALTKPGVNEFATFLKELTVTEYTRYARPGGGFADGHVRGFG